MLIAGANWSNSSSCGSRSRNSNNVRSNANANNGGRRSIRDKQYTTSSGSSLLSAECITLVVTKIQIGV